MKELENLVLSYNQYTDITKQYQQGKVQKEKVMPKLESLCKEVTGFVQMLCVTAESESDREEIKSALKYIETYC